MRIAQLGQTACWMLGFGLVLGTQPVMAQGPRPRRHRRLQAGDVTLDGGTAVPESPSRVRASKEVSRAREVHAHE